MLLVEHYKHIKAAWSLVEVGDHRIHIQSDDEIVEENFELDEIGILNLGNAMEG